MLPFSIPRIDSSHSQNSYKICQNNSVLLFFIVFSCLSLFTISFEDLGIRSSHLFCENHMFSVCDIFGSVTRDIWLTVITWQNDSKRKCEHILGPKILTVRCYHAVPGYPTQIWAGMNSFNTSPFVHRVL